MSSAGTIARDGTPATAEAILVASEHGVDASTHLARRLAREHLADAGRTDLETRVAAADARRRLRPIAGTHEEDVADPLGHPVETYRAVAWEIATWCERLTEALFGPAASDRSGGAASTGEAPLRGGVRAGNLAPPPGRHEGADPEDEQAHHDREAG